MQIYSPKAVPLPEVRWRSSRLQTLLHDIGKIGIANTFIFKEGSLTEIELAITRKHPEVSAAIVGAITPFPIDFICYKTPP